MEDKELRQSIKSDAAAKVTKADNMLKEIEAILEKAKAEKVAIADSAVAKINSVLEDARQARREEDALFEHSARELNTLIMELQRLKREGRPQ